MGNYSWRKVLMASYYGSCVRDCSSVRIHTEHKEGRVRTTVVSSIYLPHNEEAYCRSKNLKLIVGCNTNALREVWGSSNINERRVDLLEYITSTQMDIAIRCDEPNFITASRTEDNIHGRKVEKEPSLPNHRMITFGIEIVKSILEPKRRPKDTNRETYREELAEALAHLKGNYSTTREFGCTFASRWVHAQDIRKQLPGKARESTQYIP